MMGNRFSVMSCFVFFALMLMVTAAAALAEPKKQKVIDIGNLEVEGELRRPNVTWIDSQKKVRDMLPAFHRQEFTDLERRLLAPGDLKKLEKARVARGECNANR